MTLSRAIAAAEQMGNPGSCCMTVGLDNYCKDGWTFVVMDSPIFGEEGLEGGIAAYPLSTQRAETRSFADAITNSLATNQPNVVVWPEVVWK